MRIGTDNLLKRGAVIFSIVCILFIFMASASALDLNDTGDLNMPSDDTVLDISSQDILKNSSFNDDIPANETLLVGNDSEFYFNSGNSFKVLLSDASGVPLANESVIFAVNSNNYTRSTDENGMASIKINLNSGNYKITSYYAGTAIYKPCNTTNIIKILSTISGENIEKYYKNNTQYYATFTDSQGTILNNATVKFNINGVYYERKTNEKGTARLNINLNSGDYILTAINPITGEMSSNNISVLTTLIASDIVKYYKNDTQYYLILLNGAGEALTGQQVTFNINGVFYTRISNEKGIARLNINLNPGNYTITAINPLNNEMCSNNIEVLSTISADDLTMSYRDGSRFKVHVLDDDGSPLAGSNVEFNVNGVFYTRTTDKEGNAYLNINLDVDRYVITATNYNGLSVSKNIRINKGDSFIKASDAHIIAGLDRDYSVTLTGLNNKTIPLNTITFKCNGASLSVVSDENGEATILLSNLSLGEYSLEYEFKGNKNYNSYKSSSTLTVENPTTILVGNDLTMLYQDNSKFKVDLTDLNSNSMANKTITFNVNGNSYNRTTDENGVASLAINLIPGTYEISYSHSDVDAVDYNKGSNTIVVSKLPAVFYTNDLAFEYGESKSFTVNLTDLDKRPLKGIDVTFEISGNSYTRTTDASGIAELVINLPVGYYDITTSLDNLIYAADTKSNHVLVNGSIFLADNLYLIADLTRQYCITLLDAYRNPISNAVIEFTYNGVSKRAATDANGVAAITVGNLPKGDFAIVYNYIKENDIGQSNIHVSQSVLNVKNTISDLSVYLSNSKNCQVSNAEIVALAGQLTEGLTTPLDKAIAIFNYVRDSIPYSYYYDTKYGAVGTLQRKAGNCVDQSHLAVALYRAAGFPARYVHGTCTFGDGDVSGHVWIQVLVEDTWVVGDTINRRNSLGDVVNWNNNNYIHKGYYASLPF